MTMVLSISRATTNSSLSKRFIHLGSKLSMTPLLKINSRNNLEEETNGEKKNSHKANQIEIPKVKNQKTLNLGRTSCNDDSFLLLVPPDESLFGPPKLVSVITSKSTSSMTSSGFHRPTDETRKFIVAYLNQHSMLKSFIAGSISGTCSTLLFQPFDLLKTRLQNANFLVIGGSSTAQGPNRFVPIVLDVIKNEQFWGLWRGTAPSLIRCVPGLGLHFCLLDTLQSHFCSSHKPSPIEALTFGMLSRSFAGVLLIPATVVKTRYESGIFRYQSFQDAVRHIYKNEGVRGLTSGLLPTLMRDVPFSGLYFMFYSQLKNHVKIPRSATHNNDNLSDTSHSINLHSSSKNSLFFTFFCGVMAGLMASIVTQPMDVIKTHMQLQRQTKNNKTSLIQTVVVIIKRQGLFGFFSGLGPRLARRTLMASMAWTVYERMMQQLCLK